MTIPLTNATSSIDPPKAVMRRAVLMEAFALRCCQGNGASVILLEEFPTDPVLLGLARSLKQSETALLVRYDGAWLLRWFTPSCEVQLCGHATLAAVLALAHWGLIEEGEELVFHTRSGELPAKLLGASEGIAQIVLPSTGLVPAVAPTALVQMVTRSLQTPLIRYWSSPLGYSVVLLPPEAPLATAVFPPSELPEEHQCGLVLMQSLRSRDAPKVLNHPSDYQLRFLAPGLGIDEDPVTGSAHALVAPWWLEEFGVDRVVGWQCSPSPGGMLCETESSGMIRLIGSGHLLWDGTLHFDSDPSGGGDFDTRGRRPDSSAGLACPTSGWNGLLG